MTLRDLREELADELTSAGLRTYAYEPDVMSTPFALLQTGTPLIERGTGTIAFTDYVVRFDLIIAVDLNQERQLDQMVALAIKTLLPDYAIESVQAATVNDNDRDVMAALITLTVEVGKEEL